MRTNIEIDDKLMEKAIQLSGGKTKKEIVQNALEVYVKQLSQRRILELQGKVTWEGDLDEMRSM